MYQMEILNEPFIRVSYIVNLINEMKKEEQVKNSGMPGLDLIKEFYGGNNGSSEVKDK